MNESTDIVKSESGQSMTDALEIIQSRNILFDKIMQVAIRATSPGDWINQNGKPYLQGSGAEKVARRFGVKIFDTIIEREEIEDEKGKYYLYTVIGKAALSDRDVIDAIGTCSSRDAFFSHGNKLSMADVDIGNVKKAAYTNFMGNAITRLLGIRNLTWDELSKHGIGQNGKATIKYDGGASKAATTKKAANAEQQSKKPFWTSDYNGKNFLFASVGKHFSDEFLLNLGFKESKTAGKYFTTYSQEIEGALEEECQAAEVAIREEAASNG